LFSLALAVVARKNKVLILLPCKQVILTRRHLIFRPANFRLQRSRRTTVAWVSPLTLMLYSSEQGDTFFIGSVVNRQSLAVIRRSNELGLTQKQLISQFNVISEPCYEKKVLNFPLRSILGENFSLRLPGADESTNRKINEVLQTSVIDEIESGPWVYVDMKGCTEKYFGHGDE
jgi:hypothetical protein